MLRGAMTQQGFDRGWFVVAGLFLVLTISSGFGFYNLSVYIAVLAAEQGFAISQVSVAVSLFFVVGGVAGIGVAQLLDRFDVRWIMVGGAALAGVGALVAIRGEGLMIGVELDRPCGALVGQALEAGVLINVTAERVVRLLPPLTFSEADATALVETLVPLIRNFVTA